ncbi:Nse1 non-SMC component of SMC5-6 complex-domain-containing protein [Hygrophoropsis aurantiaca]|uniref:Nse1 non-SMC component of SMC5-6 complex-domain-containing protein n=1 Tax=Hygrophoropsis aurantiaca TaxID=72124 RepID=A0ACB8APA7_9AGAM|nr:Nse1 non-SMC component of SMC5-6 complex-domain-containing protein [Hygrophoropsis aurantiaca]
MVSSNDVQRLFLQAVFSRSILSYQHALLLWGKCIDAVKAADPSLDIRSSDDRAQWNIFVTGINQSLDSLDLEFRHLHDETDGREMYCLVNRRGDEVAQLATDYTAVEIAYFKAIIEQIMLAPHEAYSVSSFTALREVNSLKTNMSKTQAEVVLGSFVAKGWLLKSKRGRYSLSTRTLLEMLNYLKQTYPEECLECTICMEMVTKGIACTRPNCKTRLHDHCFNTFRRHNSKCPTCSQDWPQKDDGLVPVGEGAAKDGQDEGRRARRKSTAEDSDEDEPDMQMDEDEPSQPAATQSKTRGRKKKVVESDDDEDDEVTPQKSQPDGRRRSGRAR